MRKPAIVTVIGAMLVGVAPAAAADREGVVTRQQSYEWSGAQASGANVDYHSATGEPCGKTPDTYCDTTLVRIAASSTEADLKPLGVRVSIGDYSPNPTSDFDLYVYASDAAGNRGALKGSVGDLPGIEEATTIAQPGEYLLVQVVYYAVTESSYAGEVELLGTRLAAPPDVDSPPGIQGFLGSDPRLGFRSHSEPHIAENPLNHDMLVAGSKYYNRDPDSLPEYDFKVGTSASFDGGRTWTSLGQLAVCPPEQAPPETWPTNPCYPAEDPDRGGNDAEDEDDPRGQGDFGEDYIVSDPWLQFDDEGNVYTMVLDSPPFESGNGWGMTFHRWETPSPGDIADGRTWSKRIPINAYDDAVGQDAFLDDKNTFAINNAGPDGDGETGPMVACWTQNIDPLIKQQIVCERSTDGGRSWPEEPAPISGGQQLVLGVHVVADTQDEQTFYATWREYTPSLAGAPNVLYLARSTDGGRTWTPPAPLGFFEDLPTFPNNGFRNGIIPIAAVGPSGELYITLADYNPTDDPADEDGMQADVKLLKSTDGGATFSDPVTVNQDTGRADQFQPYVAVTPGGQVNVAFFDRRLDQPVVRDGTVVHPGNFFIDLFLARSQDGGRTFTESRLTHDSWDPSINPPISGSGEFIGDYQGLVADDCRAIAFVNDTTLANDRARDPGYDVGMPRSEFQQTLAYVAPNAAEFGGEGLRPGCNVPDVTPPFERRGDSGCTRSSGARSARVRPRGRRVRIRFARPADTRVDVDVFQSSVGRRIVGNRRVARFRDRRRSFTWNGKANRKGRRVRDGHLFVRYTFRSASGDRDVRRRALRRNDGRFRRRPDFDRPRSCGLVTRLKLERPVFGGRHNQRLNVAFRLRERSAVTVEAIRRGKVVKTLARPGADRIAGRTYRLRLRSEGLRRGTYRIRLRAVSRQGSREARAVVAARRL